MCGTKNKNRSGIPKLLATLQHCSNLLELIFTCRWEISCFWDPHQYLIMMMCCLLNVWNDTHQAVIYRLSGDYNPLHVDPKHVLNTNSWFHFLNCNLGYLFLSSQSLKFFRVPEQLKDGEKYMYNKTATINTSISSKCAGIIVSYILIFYMPCIV